MSPPQPKHKKRVVWRVRVMMAEREIRSVTELVRRLEQVGVSISIAQLGRLIDGKASHWNQEVIEGLMEVFGCELSDLLRSQ
ncbi:MAG: helix-turn-helix transcriptional regulator [Azonexus sp.]|jgi:DNA-binding Xre family transcriptional regulator|nr:helix-turn-helix transcriptional regulator [Azonexus sp.]